MNPSLEETITIDFVTSSPTTGAATDADTTPTAEVFEDATDTAIITPTVVKRTGKTGNYRVPVACTAANGFEAAKSYNVVVAATVGAVAAKAVIRTFQMRTRDIDDVSTYAGADTAGTTTLLTRIPSALTITAGAVNVNDKTGFSLTSAYDPAKTAMQAGASVTVATNNDKTGYALTAAYDSAKTASTQASNDLIYAAIDTEVGAIKTKTDQLTFTGGKVDANATVTLTSTDFNNIADAVLKRDFTLLTGEAAYSLLNAVRMLRNVWNTAGSVLTVKKEDGTTTAWTRTLATDPTAQPITGAS